MKVNGIQFQKTHLNGVNISILVSKFTQKFIAFLQAFSVLATLNRLLTLQSVLRNICFRVRNFIIQCAEVCDRNIFVYIGVLTVNEFGVQFLRNF